MNDKGDMDLPITEVDAMLQALARIVFEREEWDERALSYEEIRQRLPYIDADHYWYAIDGAIVDLQQELEAMDPPNAIEELAEAAEEGEK